MNAVDPFTPLLEVKNLSKAFASTTSLFNLGSFQAVRDINFKLEQRKTLAIIGKNGSGKSTVAKMVVGIMRPNTGTILFKGRPLSYGDYKFRSKHIRMVFQDPNSAFNPRLNVGQILDTPLQIRGNLSQEERNQKIAATLRLVGLYPDHANLLIRTMSVSQKQRIALARALILEPEIIIIDDALASLDATVKIQMMNLLLRIQRKLNIAYLYIGQNLGIIKHIADDVMVMDNGKMVEYGATKTLFTQPQSDVTKRLVESNFGRILTEDCWYQVDSLDS